MRVAILTYIHSNLPALEARYAGVTQLATLLAPILSPEQRWNRRSGTWADDGGVVASPPGGSPSP